MTKKTHVVHIHTRDGASYTECGRHISADGKPISDHVADVFAVSDRDLAEGERYCMTCATKHNRYAYRHGIICRNAIGIRYAETSYGTHVMLAG